jgi:hypothetical protein
VCWGTQGYGVAQPGWLVKMTSLAAPAALADGRVVHGKPLLDDAHLVSMLILVLFFARHLLTTCVFGPLASALRRGRHRHSAPLFAASMPACSHP